MKNKLTKIMAAVALFWIIISMIWTWLIVIFSESNTNQVELTQEQIEQVQEAINNQNKENENSEATIEDILSTQENTEENTQENTEEIK